jgi:hypothetical protein
MSSSPGRGTPGTPTTRGRWRQRFIRTIAPIAVTSGIVSGLLGGALGGLVVERTLDRPLQLPPAAVYVQPGSGGDRIILQDSRAVPSASLSSTELDDIQRQVETWAADMGVPRTELERRRTQLVNWLEPLERTADQMLGSDAEEDIRKARELAKAVKVLAEALASVLKTYPAQPSPTASPR